MEYIVLDLEWNQPYDDSMAVEEPVHLSGEIIQIGAVKLSEDFERMDTFKIMVRPVKYRKMHKKVAKITGLTDDDLEFGFPFLKALKYFRQWCGKEFSFLTWGRDDAAILRENIALYSLDDDWIPNVYDVQRIFGFQTGKPKRQFSLMSALNYFHEEALDAHDALHDALNTVKVCRHLDMKTALASYEVVTEQIREESEMIHVSTVTSVSRYPSRDAALADIRITDFLCKECSKLITCGEWLKRKQEVRVALAECPGCSRYFVQVRFRKDGDGSFRATRRVSLLTDSLMEKYQETLQIVEKRAAATEAYLMKCGEKSQEQ